MHPVKYLRSRPTFCPGGTGECLHVLPQLRAEIAALQELLARASRVRGQTSDSRLTALQECLKRDEFHELTDGRGKLLVFTEHPDTLNLLCHHLEKWGHTVTEIHGGMSPHRRKRAEEELAHGHQPRDIAEFRTLAATLCRPEALGMEVGGVCAATSFPPVNTGLFAFASFSFLSGGSFTAPSLEPSGN